MNIPRIVQRWLLAALAVTVLCWTSAAGAAVPESWKDTGFSIDPSGMTLHRVLEQFGKVYGVRVSFGVTDVAVKKERLHSNNGSDFLDRLAQPYRFRWFVYADTLYIVPRNDNASVRLEVGEDAVQDAKGALVGMGLFDSRFGWGELPDEGVIIISGPREYVRLARGILLPDEGKVAKKDRQVMVFRLKYASATDRVISARGKTETIPGVKTILSSLILEQQPDGKSEDPSTRIDVGSSKRSRKPDNGKGEAKEFGRSPFSLGGKRTATDEEEEKQAHRGAKTKHSSGKSQLRIEADPSLNAIMIYDVASKREMYQALIDQLDIQPQQIEIEALIVDIDRSKLSELGVEWGVRSSGGNVVGRMNSTQTDSKGVDLPLPGSTLLISNAARFYARLKAMEGSGQAHILATPTVLTLNNVAAVLDLSQTKYLPLLAERFADLADVTAGTMLRVIPHLVQDGTATRVRMEVDIEDGALGDVSANNASVTRSTISTQAIVDLQQTLMIGGYRAESLSNKQQKVPVLGDIPVVGNLFRNQNTSQETRERLFLITPRLMGAVGVAAAPTTSKAVDAARKLLPPPAKLETPAGADSPASAAVMQAVPAGTAIAAVAPAGKGQESKLQLATVFNPQKPSLLAASGKRSGHKCKRGKASLPGAAMLQ